LEVDDLMAEVMLAWAPPPKLTLSQWADEHAILSAESSADLGKWRTIPYQRGIMDAITDRHIEAVTVMKSARVGWTKIINHAIGFHMHYDPCPIMVVQPTIGDAEGYSKDEIAPMLRDTEVLMALVPESNRRDGGNTILHKQFPGGQLRLVGADSPRGFRRVSIRFLAFDEVDGYAATAGEEGDQIKLGIKRTDYFWNRKILAGSTPTLDSTSRIKRRFERGDMRYYFVPCPHCKQPQVLKWENLKWDKGRPETAYFMCVHNGCVIEYRHQRWMVEQADKLNLAGDPTMGWVPTNQNAEQRHASFHIWAAYSYSPNATWEQLAREWIESHKNIEERKTFINTVMGEPYKGEGDAPDWKRLYDRRENYRRNVVPAGALVLFCGVDVQKDRLELEIVGYGRRMESWSIDYRVIPGDTSQLNGPNSPWPRLSEVLNEWWDHELGGRMQVRMMAIDTGFNTSVVYQYVSTHPVSRVFGVDGRDTYQMIMGQPKKVQVNTRGKRAGKSVKLWPVGISLVKTELYGWLKQDKPTVESGQELPFGYCHFPEYGEEYFKGITAEEIVPRLVKGFRRYQWEKVYDRNEPLDCRVYARAVAALAGVDRWDEEEWKDLEDGLRVRTDDADDEDIVYVRRKITKASDPYL
jgi:phage terminase large subunit GpA-like protein